MSRMRRWRGVPAVAAAMVLALLLAVPGASAQWTASAAWIDAPLNGSKLPVAPMTVTAHATDLAGVVGMELFVDGIRVASASVGPDPVVEAQLPWSPSAPGGHFLVVQGIGANGERSSSGFTFVFVGNPAASPSPTVTPSPSPTPSPTPSPASIPPSRGPTPSATPTPVPDTTPPHAAISADPDPAHTTDVINLSVVADDAGGIAEIEIRALYVPSGGIYVFPYPVVATCHDTQTCSASVGAFGGSGGVLHYYARIWDGAGNLTQTPDGTDQVTVKIY
jgi:hypothetical protein